MFFYIVRTILSVFVVIIVVMTGIFGYFVWTNNRDISTPSNTQISNSLEQSVQWLLANRENIIEHNNSMLWWMLQESALRTGDERVVGLVEEYKETWIEPNPRSPWSCLFNPDCSPYVSIDYANSIPDYNLHFIYGLTCYPEIGGMDLVQEMNIDDFCRRRHPISPACITHQLMAVRFMQAKGCEDSQMLAELVGSLQGKIVRQLTWDPRVVDVYIQRVLMLQESGAGDRIRNVWIKQILNAQLPDGGWGGEQPLIPLWNESYLCFTGRVLGIQMTRSNFHTTAQGVLLMTLLLENE